MTDIASISAFISSVKAATDIAKFIRDSDVSIENAEMKLKLAQLISSLADARIEMAEIQSLILEKDSKIKSLEEALATKRSLKYEQPYYWLETENGRDGPFCQQCYDSHARLVRLQGYGNGYWDCKACKSGYKDNTYDDSPLFFSSGPADPFPGY